MKTMLPHSFYLNESHVMKVYEGKTIPVQPKMEHEETYFPILVQYYDVRNQPLDRVVVSSPDKIRSGVTFRVLETRTRQLSLSS